jgi:ABC-type branched-subunit amino acid transport system permease subunit
MNAYLKNRKNILGDATFGLVLVVILFILYPFLMSNYFIDVAFFFGIYALLGLSLNVVLGEVGLFDLGHAGFYAIGAYTTAILNTTWVFQFWFFCQSVPLPPAFLHTWYVLRLFTCVVTIYAL